MCKTNQIEFKTPYNTLPNLVWNRMMILCLILDLILNQYLEELGPHRLTIESLVLTWTRHTIRQNMANINPKPTGGTVHALYKLRK